LAFLYSSEQLAIREAAFRQLSSRFDSKTLHAIIERGAGHDANFWSLCRESGWTGVTIDATYGGLGLGLVELCLITEAAGQVIAGAPFLLSSFGAADAIGSWGSDLHKSQWLGALAAGELIGAVASTEGNMLLPIAPETSVSGGRIRGQKHAVTAGAVADLAIVQARAEDGQVGLYVVSMEGVRRNVIDSFDPSRGAVDLIFEGQNAERLPASNAESLGTLLARLAVVMAAEQLGGADACIKLARDYACTRQAFGQPIGRFQSVKHGIAEVWILAQLARAAVFEAAQRWDSQVDTGALAAAAAAARLNASEAYEKAAWMATQVHGAIGVTWDADLHLHYRRARALAVELGQPALWEDRIVAVLEQGQ
jgi:acyl-CoA dehydrogenase